MSKSCYVLELSVPPGGLRRGDVYAYNQWRHMRSCLEQELVAADPRIRSDNVLFAIAAGATIGIWIVQAGKTTRFIDLHPFIQLRIDGGDASSLDDESSLDALGEQLEESDFVIESAEFEIDWDGIAGALPSLEGALLGPGESTPLQVNRELAEETHLYLVEELTYGYSDLECGEHAPEHFTDPDP